MFERNHPGAIMHNMSVHEVDGRSLPQVELMTIGLPCEPFSTVRRNPGRGSVPEDHDHGDLVYWALKLVQEVAPYTVVLEEVPGFLESGAGFILMGALRRMGYTVDSRIVDPHEHGELAGRRRAVVVATTAAEVRWPATSEPQEALSAVLEPLDDEDPRWFTRETKPWLWAHWERQEARGNRFQGQVLTGETRRVGCITKRYFNGQGGNAVIAHPSRPGTFRWLTIREACRLHGLPAEYLVGLSLTTAGEVLGQGVVVPTLQSVIQANIPE